jgi:hypothetical protein
MQDTWALELGGTPHWIQLFPTGGPPPVRSGHSAIYDPVRRRMVVYAGEIFPNVVRYDDVWSLWLGGEPMWSQLAPAGIAPSPRSGHSAIYDPLRDRMVAFSGRGAAGDVWSLDFPTAVAAVTPAAGVALALRAANPCRSSHVALACSLSDASPARVEVLDVSGRLLVSRDLPARAGTHTVALEAATIPGPGLYFARLIQGAASVTTRIAIVQ